MMKAGIAKFSANQMLTIFSTVVMLIKPLGKAVSSGKLDCVLDKSRAKCAAQPRIALIVVGTAVAVSRSGPHPGRAGRVSDHRGVGCKVCVSLGP